MRPTLATRSSLSSRARNARGGFALLITITLLAFIVVLLLGLAVYTRIETSIAGNTQRQAQARENALLGLNVALAQLQKHAGSDTRVTATAANFGAIDGTHHYTGVWNSADTNSATPAAPLTWLVSGNEVPQPDIPDPNPDAPEGSTVPAPLAVTPAVPGTRLQPLVGRNTTGDTARSASWVDAPLVDITTIGVPGVAPSAPPATIGRYAWWVGDQGVKAPVAVSDVTSDVTFAPYDSAELQGRLRQQLPLGAGAVDASGAPLFEPRDSNNSALVANGKVAATNQLAFLRTPTNAQVGFARAQQNFHAWSPNNFAVIADTKRGGLRQDLSLLPTLLGSAFAAWTNYSAYMEKFTPDVVQPPADGEGVTAEPAPTSTAPAIVPAYSADPVRRRYVMTPHLLEPAIGGSHQVGPILTYFLLSFNVRTEGNVVTPRPLEVRARWMFSLWNPYTSALVPENLRIEIAGLPTSVVVQNEVEGPLAEFSLRDAFGSPLRTTLPWTSNEAPAGVSTSDRQSWLPGRVYTWRSLEDTTISNSIPSEGFPMKFYPSPRIFTDGSDTNQGVQRSVRNSPAIRGDTLCSLLVGGSDQIVVTLFAVRPDGDVRLGRFMAPNFVDGFTTAVHQINASSYQFSYVFRLAESIDTPTAPGTWLSSTGRDIRRRTVPSEAFVVGENGNSPEQYENYVTIAKGDRLLDRASDAYSYNEDVPLFELPRGPILSLGALQHFRLVGQRPFMIGNPWGVTFELNQIPTGQLFDRFFFSGVTSSVVPATNASGDLTLPNVLLKPLRKADGTKVTMEDVRPTPVIDPEPTEPVEPPVEPPVETTPVDPSVAERIASTRTSKHFLQGGAFNLNSTNAVAWAAALRNVRFPSPQSFTFLDGSAETGTAEDTALGSVQSTDAQFFRFSQSAQETYKAEPGMADNDPALPSPARTELFRRGMRTLDAGQVTALATKIVELVGLKHAATDALGGPFRSLEEFLSPSALFAGVDTEGNALAPRSLLEAAIADAGINSSIPEFSSQWLTQGDVMTSLAPILFPRSDTFVIRAYGEAVNPATNAVEGKAWAEAIVQRIPEYLADPANHPAEKLPSAFDVPVNPDDATSGPTQADQLNQKYGRRFKVVSFRWLTRSDI